MLKSPHSTAFGLIYASKNYFCAMIKWTLKNFDDLTLRELYGALALRQAVFVVEQNCPYVDADGRDQAAFHLFAHDTEGDLVACTRLIPAGISYEKYASIGRVVTAEKVRGTGLGRELMARSIEACGGLFPGQPVKISAQAHLEKFYQSLGFAPTGEAYLEDGIPHVGMILGQKTTI